MAVTECNRPPWKTTLGGQVYRLLFNACLISHSALAPSSCSTNLFERLAISLQHIVFTARGGIGSIWKGWDLSPADGIAWL